MLLIGEVDVVAGDITHIKGWPGERGFASLRIKRFVWKKKNVKVHWIHINTPRVVVLVIAGINDIIEYQNK